MRALGFLVCFMFALAARAQVTLTHHGLASSVGAGAITIAITANAGDMVTVSTNTGKFNHNDPAWSLAISGCLTWTSRTPSTVFFTQITGGTQFNPTLQESWKAVSSGALSACTVTITPSGLLGNNLDGSGTLYMAFSGTAPAAPFDPNPAVPATGISNGTTPASAVISTSNSADVVFFYCAQVASGCASPGPVYCPTGYTLADQTQGNGSTLFHGMTSCYRAFSSAQSALVVTSSGATSAVTDSIIVDALTSVAGGRPRLIQ